MGTATISYGPKLGLINNAAINQVYVNQLRAFLQAMDQLINGSVINATTAVPPSSPNNGDAYLLTGGTPSGAWLGQAGNIAVWDTQVTNAGTNTLNPAWVFYTPQQGWILWNIALAGLYVYNGSAWTSLAGGANFPTNTDITSMTGIPNTTINTSGYTYSDGTNPPIYVGNAATTASGVAGPNGLYWGTGNFTTPTSGGAAFIGEGPWTGLGVTGVGVGVVNSVGSSLIYGGGIGTTGTVEGNTIVALTSLQSRGIAQVTEVQSFGTVYPGATISFVSQITPPSTAGPVYSFQGGGTSAGSGNLMGFANYPAQTTVGAAGGASTLPVTPTGYLQVFINGNLQVIPYYAAA